MHFRTDLYRFLGLQNFASRDEIRSAYRKLALQNHPDKGGDLKKMQLINNVKDILLKHKDEYDRALHRFLNPVLQPQVVVKFYSYTNPSVTTSTGNW